MNMSDEQTVVENEVLENETTETEAETTDSEVTTTEEAAKRTRNPVPEMAVFVATAIRFIKAGKSLDELVEELGCAKSTVQQKLTIYRNEPYNIPIPNFKGGNRSTGPKREDRDKAAADEVRAAAEKLLAELGE